MKLAPYRRGGVTPWFGDIDRWFENFLDWPAHEQQEVARWRPAVDIYEQDDKIVLKADLPDVNEKDLDIRLEDGILTLKAERKFEETKKGDGFRRIERAYGSFERSFSVPENVDPDKIEAHYDKGVLTVTLPKVETKEKKVKVVKVK